MTRAVRTLRTFLRDEDAPTATEYAVMLALIIVVAIGAVTLLGSRVSASLSNSATAVEQATGS